MDETYASEQQTETSHPVNRRRKKRRNPFVSILLGILKIVGTILAIGLLTAALFFRTFMHYVNTTLEPEIDVDISAYTLKQSSVIYYQDKRTGQWVELQKIHGSENRTLIDYEQIPDHVVKALIAIEDERFYEHKGVDWKRTLKVSLDMLSGRGAQGGSTITQQVIKNVTGENQVTIRRKILEIFRALRVHEKYTEEDILETYFNLVFFGHKAYGIEAAAETYFGKSVEDLTVAEGAAIVGITQNPWKFDPLRNDATRENNRNRQLTVLDKMHECGWLTDSEYAKAKAEKLVFVGDEDYVEKHEEGEETAETSSAELDSFFVEQVFNDVVEALMDQKHGGYGKEAAQLRLYTGGYKIYCTLDPEIQELVESVYADQGNFNYKSDKGEMLQSGMTVIDNENNNIVAIAGRVGERHGAFEWSYAASSSPCGSAIKPLSVYAPAIDAGLITAASVIDDYPVQILNGDPWPVNAYSGYRGLMTIQDALRISSNTTAVRVVEKLSLAASYAFMTENLGFTTLDPEDMQYAGSMALGGLKYGVSTIEMCAAYSTFANNGVYTRPRTFIEVVDSYGNVVIDNRQDSWVAMKESTVYTINELLKNVVKSGGTGTSAAFSGMTMAGKTGTTNSKRDKYFVGYTPYYTAAVWCGFPTPTRIGTDDNPAAVAWNKVMKQIHEGLEDKDFPTTSEGMVSVTVCNKTGLLAGSGCGSTRRVLVREGTAPAYTCDAHTSVRYCTVGEGLAGEFCPEEDVETRYYLDLSAPKTSAGFGYQRKVIMRGMSSSQYASYAAKVEAGELDAIPGGSPVYANDSDSLLINRSSKRCSVHTAAQEVTEETPPEEEQQTPPEGQTQQPSVGGTEQQQPPQPQQQTDMSNPVDWFENLGGQNTKPPEQTTPTPPQQSEPQTPEPHQEEPPPAPAEPAPAAPEQSSDNAEYLDWFLNLKDDA